MGLFGLLEPNVEKLRASRDVDGLLRVVARVEKQEPLALAAARALAELRAPRAVAALVPWLQHDRLRPPAAEALGAIGDLRALEPLLRSLLFAPESARDPVTAALRAFGAPGIDATAALLAGSDEALQLAAARALGNLGEARAIPPLIAALERNPAWNVATAIVTALVQIGPTAIDAVTPLVRQDGPAQVRTRGIECLVQLRDPRGTEALAQLLDDSPAPVKYEAARALRQLHWQPSDVRQQVLLAAYGSADWAAIAALGTPARDVVLELADLMPEARGSIFATLSRIDPDWLLAAPPAMAVPILDAALTTGLAAARAEAEAALPRLMADASPEFLRQAGTAREPRLRRLALAALGRHGAAAVPALVSALADDDDAVRNTAAEQLVVIGAPAVPALIAALSKPAAQQAARVLGRIGDPRAIKPLASKVRGGREYSLAWVAGEVLAGFGAAGARELIDALLAGQGGKRAEGNPAAAAALGLTGEARAVGPLVDFLARERDLGCLVKAEQSLWQILGAAPAQVSDDDLHAIAGLANRTLSVYATSDYSWDHGSFDDHEHDFSRLRAWADEALAGRHPVP